MARKGKQVKEQYQLEARDQHKKRPTSLGVEMEITLFFKDNRKRDVDNYNKLVLDSLEGIVYQDDSQIQKLTITKNYSKENPRIEVEIKKCQE